MAKLYSAEEVITAIQAKNGILASAARALGCSRSTIYKYVNDYPTVKKAYDDANEVILDLAESKLYEAVKDGQLPAIFFLLRTKGRSRGYAERVETTGEDGGPIVVKLKRDDD